MTSDLRSIDARTGAPRPGEFREATQADVESAASAAREAGAALAALEPREISALLRGIAEGITAIGEELLTTADAESALGVPRITGERARTNWQLEAFARLVETGDHLDAVIDRRDQDAVPVPRPDLRRINVPIGPIAVFAASNFPLAFSVAGGDSAAALAAGCPVVVKAHPFHPATSELVAAAVVHAVAAAGLPSGVFSLLHGTSTQMGRWLVEADPIAGVGFTGSLAGGRALFDAAAARPRPIPVYAEMGSTNPVFVTQRAAEDRAAAIAEGLANSFTLGVGQFCTKPGLVFVGGRGNGERMASTIADHVRETPPQPMLNQRLFNTLQEQLRHTTEIPGVRIVGRDTGSGGEGVVPVVLAASVEVLAEHPELGDEHFGPVLVVVACEDDSALLDAAHALPGNLTATVHAEDSELDSIAALTTALQSKVGRIVWNGYPTGVSVTDAMVHGGPYPATTASATTSVGLAAIRRFQRPVAWQEAPNGVLPAGLRDDNPWGIRRKVDGVWGTGRLTR